MGGGGGAKGKLTITGMPSNALDAYIIFSVGNTGSVFGLAEKPASTDSDAEVFKAVRITSTTAVIPLWKLEAGSSGVSWVGYGGTESKETWIYIGFTEKTSQNGLSEWADMSLPIGDISFTNGNATVSAADYSNE